jgi:8-oxo-dGTP diphosphatase
MPPHLWLQDDAEAADWWDVTKLPKLAFDHKLIVRTAFQHVLDRHAAKGGVSCLLLLPTG